MTHAFSVTSSAVAGFQLIGRKPKIVAIWVAVSLIFTLAVFGAAYALVGREMIAFFQAIARDQTPNAASGARLLTQMLTLYGVVGLPLVIGLLVMSNAIMRAILRPDDSSFAYLRLGMDEVLVFVFGIVLGIGLIVPMAIGALLIVAVSASELSTGLKILINFVLGLGMLVAVIWLAVRLSLVGAGIVATHRLDIGRDWALTRGHFWPLVGLALLVFVIAFAIQLVSDLLVQGVMLSAMLPAVSKMQAAGPGSDPSAIFQVLVDMWPMLAVVMLAVFIIAVLRMVITTAPYAAAYRGLAGPDVADSASVFD